MGEQVAAGFPWGISSVGRAPALQAGGHEFESRILHFMDSVAALLLHYFCVFDKCVSVSYNTLNRKVGR